MKITFPHFGNAYLAAKALFDGMGVDYVLPPMSSKSALEIGSMYSPEDICLPFKIMIGSYIQSIEKGADTIIIAGSCGPCRFGEYCELQMNILKKLGYDVNFIVVDYPSDIGVQELIRRVGKVVEGTNTTTMEKLRAGKNAVKVLKLTDELDALAHELSGYEKHKGECKKLLNRCKREAVNINNPENMIGLLENYKRKIKKIEVDKNRSPIRIAIIGEIYTIIEPFSNMYIEDRLMDYGVSTTRKLTPTWWIKNAALSPIKMNSLDINKAAREYLSLEVGGYAKQCVGEAIVANNQGYDGAIQVFPVGCMPEIVSKSILPSISRDKDFPIMSIIMDEITGDAGYVTRLEAFIDMLNMKREKSGHYK